jgi:hypothetical protein
VSFQKKKKSFFEESAIRAEVESAAKNVILGLLHHQHIPY